MSQIGFFRPETIIEASDFLVENPEARLVAGGTDLIVKWKNGLIPKVSHFVDLGELKLDRIRVKADKVLVGSACTMTQIAENPDVCARYPALVKAVLQVGALQIRNLATIGGNVANASPAGDSIPALMSLETRVVIAKGKKSRKISLDEFFISPGKSILKPGEIIEAFEIPDRKTKGTFIKLGERLAHAISKVSLALTIWKSSAGHQTYRIALGAVAPKVIRCRRAEAILEASSGFPSAEVIEQACKLAIEDATPIDDIRSVKEYRSKMVGVLLGKALEELR